MSAFLNEQHIHRLLTVGWPPPGLKLTLILPDDGGDGTAVEKFVLVHRNTVCAHSTRLDAFCRGAFSLGESQGTGEHLHYRCHADSSLLDPETLQRMVHFWYSDYYEDEDHHRPSAFARSREPVCLMSAEQVQAALKPSGDIIWSGPREEIDSGYEDEGESEDEDEGESEDEDEDEELEAESGDDYEGETTQIDDTKLGPEPIVLKLEPAEEHEADHLNHIPARTTLTTSMQVFAAADYWGVPKLKLVARNRFYQCVEREMLTGLVSPEFSSCVDKIFTLPAALVDMSLLKEIVMKSIYAASTYSREPLATTVAKHSELSFALLKFRNTALRRAKRRHLESIRLARLLADSADHPARH